VEDYGRFEAYSNRDSLKYRSVYGLDDVTLYRGTVRRSVFQSLEYVCSTGNDGRWLCDGGFWKYELPPICKFVLAYHPTDSVEIKTRLILKIDQDDIMWDKLLELDLFNSTKIVGLKMLRLRKY
jgi:hypothetical protein